MSPQRNRYLIIYISALFIANLSFMSTNFSIYYLSVTLVSLGFSKVFIGLTLGIPRYVVIILGLFVRKIADRVNKLYLSILGSLFGFIAFTGFSFVQNPYGILALSFCYGIALMISMTMVMAVLMDYIPQPDRGRVVGFFAISSSLGAVFGPLLTDIINMLTPIENPSMRMISGSFYSVLGCLSLILALIYSKKIEPVTIESPSSDIAEIKKTTHSSSPRLSVYFPVIPMTLIMSTLFFTMMNFVSIYVHSFASESAFFMGFGVMAVLMRLFLSNQFSSWNRRILFRLGLMGYVTCVAGFILLQNFPNTFFLLLIGGLLGITHGIIYPNLTVLFSDITPKHTGNSGFVLSIFFMMGGGIGAPIFGFIADYLGFYWMYIILFILGVTSSFYINLNPRFHACLHHINKVRNRF